MWERQRHSAEALCLLCVWPPCERLCEKESLGKAPESRISGLPGAPAVLYHYSVFAGAGAGSGAAGAAGTSGAGAGVASAGAAGSSGAGFSDLR